MRKLHSTRLQRVSGLDISRSIREALFYNQSHRNEAGVFQTNRNEAADQDEHCHHGTPKSATIVNSKKILGRLGKGFHRAGKWLNGSPYPFLLQPIAFLLWIAFLGLVFCANMYLVIGMTTPHQLDVENYALPWNPSLYIVVGVTIQVHFVTFLLYVAFLLTCTSQFSKSLSEMSEVSLC